MIARAYGLVRSLAMYYGPVWRRRRMVAFYGQFLTAGDLAFDLGAHVGNRIRAFRRLGARVVAVEPQPDLLAVLRTLYGRDGAVVIEPVAVGAMPGQATLHISRRSPTLSTIAPDWMRDVRADRRFESVAWDAARPVEVTTLDTLIARHGEPRFTKIDVEGGEPAVLAGLSHPLRALSFEYLPVARDRAVACVDRLAAMADYRFRTSRAETLRWDGPWQDAAAVKNALGALAVSDRSGDVYALLATEVRR